MTSYLSSLVDLVKSGEISVTVDDQDGIKTYYLDGETYPVKDAIKDRLHASWDHRAKAWEITRFDDGKFAMPGGSTISDPEAGDLLDAVIDAAPQGLASVEDVRSAILARLEAEREECEAFIDAPYIDVLAKLKGLGEIELGGEEKEREEARRKKALENIETAIDRIGSASPKWIMEHRGFAGDGWDVSSISIASEGAY